MEKIDRRSRSLWMDTDVMRGAQTLINDHECDTVIVGAGIAGISTAYELASRGQKVIVIDRSKIAGGLTARTTAHLAPLCDDLTSEMMKLRSEVDSRGFYESQGASIDPIEEIIKAEKIDCDFRRLDGYLFQEPDTDPKMIDDELEALRKVGAPVPRLVGVPLEGCGDRHVLRYPGQGHSIPSNISRACAKDWRKGWAILR
jgi:glycine/D-amino acid oxidase-like deaminating enzyme